MADVIIEDCSLFWPITTPESFKRPLEEVLRSKGWLAVDIVSNLNKDALDLVVKNAFPYTSEEQGAEREFVDDRRAEAVVWLSMAQKRASSGSKNSGWQLKCQSVLGASPSPGIDIPSENRNFLIFTFQVMNWTKCRKIYVLSHQSGQLMISQLF
jgi:hypothetical protein